MMDKPFRIPTDQEELDGCLWWAADGWPEWAKALLDAGANPNGFPLIMAVQCDQPEIVRMMIEAGADVDLDYEGMTPLVRACGGTHPEVVKVLVQAGADVNKKTRGGWTPLRATVQQGRTDATAEERQVIVQMLKAAGAVETES